MKRRRVLQILGTAGAGGIAGCNTTTTNTNTTKPTDTGTTTNTATPVDDQAPRITAYEATPHDYGRILEVLMEGEDDTELEKAAILYGDQRLHEEPDGKKVTVEGELKPDENLESPDQVVYLLRDAAGHETQREAYPDQNAPELAVKTSTTDNAGELELLLEGTDGVGLQKLAAVLNGEGVRQEKVSEDRQASIETTVTEEEASSVQPFQKNIVTATAIDQYDNKTEKTVEQYVRKYDVLKDTSIDIAGLYNPNQGRNWKNCMPKDTNPVTGAPGDPISSEITSRHIDQMQGHGITSVVYTTNGHPNNRYWLEEFMDSELVDETRIGARYWTGKTWRWTQETESWKDILKSDTTWIRDNILRRENTRDLDGRPVITIAAIGKFATDKQYKERVIDEWGSYEKFVNDFRSHLTLSGKEPFLIAELRGFGAWGYNETKTNLGKQFDGVSNWLGRGSYAGEDQAAGWDEVLHWIEDNYEGHLEFAEEHDMEFIPNVFPGFNERIVQCREGRRYTPRSSEAFQKLLELADEYRTTDMIDIGTWNAWTEGTQIEPGTWKGEKYGTDYLEVIEQFQQGESG